LLVASRIYVRHSRAAVWSRRAGALTVPVLALAAVGHRIGMVPTEGILPVLVLGFGIAVVALAFALFAFADIWFTGAFGLRDAVIGTVYAAPALVLLGLTGAGAVLYPHLSDISTDVQDPPVFASGRPPIPSAAARTLQVEAYPEITAHVYPVDMTRAYTAVEEVVRGRGWTVTSDVPPLPPDLAIESPGDAAAVPEGVAAADAAEEAPESTAITVAQIDTVAPTLLFGFPDQVAIRLTEGEQGTRVDVRSASQIGTHDLGENARRIRSFFAELDEVLQGIADAGAGEAQPSEAVPAVPLPRALPRGQ
jgi:hypothetical protein